MLFRSGYVRDKNRLEDKREALDDARLSLAKAQEDQNRAEVMYGLNSERANKAADRTEKRQDKVLAQELSIAQMKDRTDRAGQAITQAGYSRPTEASMAYEYADAVQRGDTKRADAIKQSLELMNTRGYGGVPGGNSAQSMVINQIHNALLSDPSYRPDLRIGGKAGNPPDPAKVAVEAKKSYKDLGFEQMLGGDMNGSIMGSSAQPAAGWSIVR